MEVYNTSSTYLHTVSIPVLCTFASEESTHTLSEDIVAQD